MRPESADGRGHFETCAQQRCHHGIQAEGGAWSGESWPDGKGCFQILPQWDLNPSWFWLIFELSVTDWASQCHIFLNMHKAMESFHSIYGTLSCGTLGT